MVLAVGIVALLTAYGPTSFGQSSINGVVTGSYYALGAIGLTMIYGILRLTNFAYGDYLTLGAYAAVVFDTTLHATIGLSLLAAMAAVAVYAVLGELVVWRPLRTRGAGSAQLMIMSLGLAFVTRYGLQLIFGGDQRNLDVNVTSTFKLGPLHIGRTEFYVVVIAFVAIALLAALLIKTSFGRQMRAMADNAALARTTGINTTRVVMGTWVIAGALAGLAGTLSGATLGTITPNIGLNLLLSLFAAVILGGIGNAAGALVGGLVLSLVQEWSTLVVSSQWKIAIGFAVLIVALVARPQGLFGKAGRL